MDEDELEDYFRNVKLERFTTNTIVDKEGLMEDIRQIRKLGLQNQLEKETGTSSMSAPIFDYLNKLAGCVTVSGPDSMLTEDNINKFAPLLLEAARKISIRYGNRRYGNRD